jgi:hypothetical protein
MSSMTISVANWLGLDGSDRVIRHPGWHLPDVALDASSQTGARATWVGI